MKRNIYILLAMATILAMILMACGTTGNSTSSTPANSTPVPQTYLKIFADYQVKAFQNAGVFDGSGIDLQITYGSSSDVKTTDQKSDYGGYDAVWATSDIWLPNTPKTPEPTAKSYPVLLVDENTLKQLGWDVLNVKTAEVIGGMRSRALHMAMTNVLAADPSTSFYIATDTALNNGVMLSNADIDQLPASLIRDIFQPVLRATDSVETLKSEIVADRISGAFKYNAAVVYEATAIQINQLLIKSNVPPMQVVYVRDAISIAKFPLLYTGKSDSAYMTYRAFVAFMRTSPVTSKLQALGFRTALLGMTVENPDIQVFNPGWGIISNQEFPKMDYPRADVIDAALGYFLTSIRKPITQADCLDRSGSMNDNGGHDQLMKGLDEIYNPAPTNSEFMLGPKDRTIIYGYNDQVTKIADVVGKVTLTNEQKAQLTPLNGTAMFSCIQDAVQFLTSDESYDPANRTYVVYVMTDGASNRGVDAVDFKAFYDGLPEAKRVKIYGIGFGGVDLTEHDPGVIARDYCPENPASGCTNNSPLLMLHYITGDMVIDGRTNLIDGLKALVSNY
jgi:hypothetical protein